MVLSKSNVDCQEIWDKVLLYGTPWGKLFKSSLIKENNIIFPVNFTLHEDHIFFYETLLHTNNIRLTRNYGYNYVNYGTETLSRKKAIRDYAQNTDIMYEYQYDTLFSSVQKGRLDGIIVAANCIGCYTTKERMVEFMHHYDGIPCVLVSSDLEGYVNVSYDNDRGIRQGIDYLVQDLHYTKIGMVGGPKENSDAMERKATFESALWKNGILPQEKRYVEGDLTGNAHSTYARLLDDNPDLEAVFCVNDETAAGFYEELKARGLMPGRDISVFGYDDTEWCSQIYPTLSSVRADVSKLGSKACELLCRMMQGEKVSSVRLPTDLVVRNSFCRGNQERVPVRQ